MCPLCRRPGQAVAPRRLARSAGRQGRRGSSLVEFGLLALPLLLLIFGAIEGGRFVWSFEQVSDAARQGARYAIANYSTVVEGTDAGVSAAARSTVDGAVAHGLTVTLDKSSTGPIPYVEVTASLPFQPVTRLVPFSGTLRATARMYVP